MKPREPEPAPTPSSDRTPGFWIRLACALALALATVATFGSAVLNSWAIIDDPAYVTANPHVLGGLTPESVRWAFTQPHGGNWHPLTSLSHMLDMRFTWTGADGLPDPAVPHAVNVALHALASVLLLYALARLTRAWWPSFAVAALYALHPLRVESVVWIAERKDVLSACGFMLTLLAYSHWCRRPSWPRYVGLVLALAFGLLAKPMLVTTPFVLLLLDVWPLRRLPLDAGRRLWLERVREKLPLFVLAALVIAMTMRMQAGTGAVTTFDGLPFGTRVANAVVSYARYLGALVWPLGLAVIRPHPRVIEWGALAVSLTVLLVAAGLAWRQRARRPWLAVGYAWFLGMLVPVLGLVQVGRQGWADRYSQLPCIGVLIAVVWAVGEWVGEDGVRRRMITTAAVVLALVLAILSVQQVARWRDNVTLFEWTVSVTGPNAFAELGLGGALMQAGRPTEAERHLARAVVLEPDDTGARERWATALVILGRVDSARTAIRDGLERSPWPGGYERLGMIESKAGNTAAAVAAYRAAIAAGAPTRELGIALAGALAADGQSRESIELWSRLSDSRPGDAQVLRRLADALDDSGRALEALARYRQLIQLQPDMVAAYVRVGWLLACSPDARVRDGAAALQMAEAATTRLKSRPAVVLALTAAAQAESGQWAEAVASAREAVKAAEAEHSPGEVRLYREQLRLHEQRKPLRIGE